MKGGPALAPPAAERDVFDAVWRAFVSLKLTFLLLAALAVASVVGTFASPTPVPMDEVRRAYGDGVALTVIRAFELHHVFHSWWFSLLLIAFGFNLVACSLDRLPRVLQKVLWPPKRLTDDLFAAQRFRARLPAPQGADPAILAKEVGAAFRARGFRAESETRDGAVFLFAERGRFSRLGVYVVHLSLVVVLAGGIVGRLWGRDGVVTVAEAGGAFDILLVRGLTGSPEKDELGFTVRVEDFRLKPGKEKGSIAPESDLVLLRGGAPVARGTVSGNRGLEYAGWTLRQHGYESSPDLSLAKVSLVDRVKGTRRDVKAQGGQKLEMDDGTAFRIVAYDVRDPEQGPFLWIERSRGGASTRFQAFEGRPGADPANPEDRWQLGFEGMEDLRFSSLRLSRDPGSPLVFAGCLALVFGLFQSFYTSHRTLWARITPGEIDLAGAAHKMPEAFAGTFEGLVRAMSPQR